MNRNLFLIVYLIVLITSTEQTLPRNYHLILIKLSWADAQNYCRMMYTDLAIMMNNDDVLQLKKEATRYNLSEPAWIGLYDDFNSWRWSLKDIFLKKNMFTNWITGEPNNYAGRESCCRIYSTLGYWGDKTCSDPKPFICYNGNFSGADRFIGVSSPQLNWAGAKTYCRTYHTDLASSLNSSDNNFLAQVANVQGDSWFGLYRQTWKWLNNTMTSNLPWYPGQPNNYGGTEYCASVFQGLYSDEECANTHYFFCYTDPIKKQIVRVQVKSDQSVFDPAVQSSILEQMKKKLEGHVMSITMYWSLQADGGIFYRKNKQDP